MNRLLRLILVPIAVLAGAGLAPGIASAHSGKQSYVYVETFDDGLAGRVEYPARDLEAVLGIDLPRNPEAALRVAQENREAIVAYTSEHFAIGDGASTWTLEFGDVDLLAAAGNYVLLDFVADQSFDEAPRNLTITFDGIIHANPEKDALLLIENDWGSATFANESEHIAGFSVGMTTLQVELDDVATITSMMGVRGLGTDAVRIGIDHLLFVVALLLPVGLVATGRRPSDGAPTVQGAVRRAARLLVVFAGAHSVTLWLTGLGVLDPTDRLASSLVAGSLLVMAVYAVWRFTTREEVVVATLGLLQGLGLGVAFVASGLDRRSPLLSLIAFTIGVEVAVLVVTVLVLPVLLLVRRTAIAPVILYGGATVIGAYAMAWLVERVGDSELAIEEFANPLRVWPRNLWIMVLVIASAGVLYRLTASRGRLRPLAIAEPTIEDAALDTDDDPMVRS